jgi:hypothetical protein
VPKPFGRVDRETGGVVLVEGAAGLVATPLFSEVVALGAEKLEKRSGREYAHLEIPHRTAESLAGDPADEGLLVPRVPALDLRQLKWKVVLVPDVEQKAEDIALVGAQRNLSIETDGVLRFVFGGELAVADEEIDGVESVGEELPRLERRHL